MVPPQLGTLELVCCDVEVSSPLQGSQLTAVYDVGLMLPLREGQLSVGDIEWKGRRPGRAPSAEETAALLNTLAGHGRAAPAESGEASGSGGTGSSSGGSSSFAVRSVELRGLRLRLPSGARDNDGLKEATCEGAALGSIRDFVRRTPARLGRLLLQAPSAVVDEAGLQGVLVGLQAFLLVVAGPVGCIVVSCDGEADVRHVVTVVSAQPWGWRRKGGARPGRVEVRGCGREVWEEAVAGAAASLGAGAGVEALVVWEAGGMY